MNLALRAMSVAVCVALHALPAHAFKSPLEVAAPAVPQAGNSPMFAVTRVGQGAVAVGRHGVIIHRADSSQPWQQAKVPVSNDLVDVAFAGERNGWAVGHGGVVLHTADSGVSWARQLDGKAIGDIAKTYYTEPSATAHLPPAAREAVVAQAERWAAEGTRQPLLGVWFKDEKTGYVVGAFNRVLRTVDGGRSWVPLIDRIDNPDEFHLYAVRGVGDDVYLVGESGNVWRWDEGKTRFLKVSTPYNGSLFGVLASPKGVVVYGMRGSVFRTVDRGASWTAIQSGVTGGIVAGDLWSSDRMMLLTQSGEVLVSENAGESFSRTATGSPGASAAGVLTPQGGVLVAGPAGMRIQERVLARGTPVNNILK